MRFRFFKLQTSLIKPACLSCTATTAPCCCVPNVEVWARYRFRGHVWSVVSHEGRGREEGQDFCCLLHRLIVPKLMKEGTVDADVDAVVEVRRDCRRHHRNVWSVELQIIVL
jgi:hypothetical protein